MLKRLLAAIFLLSLTAVAAHAQGAAGSKSILLLYSYNHGAKGVDIFDEGLLDTLYASGFKVNDLYFEYLDLERNKGDAEYLHHWRAELERKYPEGKIDLVFAARLPAMNLLMKEGNRIAPGAPVISFQTPLPTEAEAGNRKVYCVVSEFDVAGTIANALSAFPKTKKVFVVAGDSEADRMAAKSVEKAGEQFKGRVEFEYTTGKTYDEVLKRASSTAPDTVILFTQFNRGAAGKVTVAYEVEAALIKAANAPVFGLYDFNLRNGGVGGSVMGVHNLGVETAKLMVEVLEGKAKGDQQVNKVNFPTIHMFDWDQIVKWGGSPQKLPPGSVFKNRSPTLFEAYGWYIAGFSLILVLQAIFIAILLEARRRKLYAEAKQKESELFRRALFDCSRLPMVVMDQVTHRFLDCNPAAVVSYGFGSLKETLGKTPLDVSAPTQYNNKTSAEVVLRHIEQAAQDGSEVFEWRHRRPDGTEWDAEVHLLSLEVAGVKLLQFSLVDITERKRAEEALRESEERFLLAMKASNDGLFDWNLEINKIYYSPAWKKILGYEDHELPNDFSIWENNTNSEDVKKSWELQKKLISKQIERFVFEFKMKHKNGHWVDILSRAEAIFSDSGQAVRIVGTHTDITERKRVEEQLRESSMLLARSQQIAHLGSWKLDVPANRLEWSDEVFRIFGCEPQEFGTTYEAFLGFAHPDDRAAVAEAYTRSLQERRDSYEIEHRIIRKATGEVRFVHERAVHEFDDTGAVIRSIGMVQDITERKRANEELSISEERNRQIIHSSIDGFWRVDTQARLIEVNDAYCRMSGYSREELLTMAVRDLEALESAEDIVARNRRIIENGIDRFTTSHRRKDGRIFEVEISIQYRSGEEGGEFAVFLRDVTEKRHLESQLRQAQKLEAIGTLAGGIAHDFNNILAAIVGYAEIIRDDFPPGWPGIDDINQVLKASHRAKDLVKQILAFSHQSEDQKIPMQPSVVVKEAIALLRSSLPTTITIEQEIDTDAGMVLANPTQIHQIVMNLATNAFHAMEVKGGTLTISLEKKILSQDDLATAPDLRPGTFVRLAIRDTGEGILPEIREKIFDPFFTTKEIGKGTGLGLSMVYSIVKGSGGSITCDSRMGEGTEFCIILPALEGPTVQENESRNLIPHGKEHILLIDDEEMLVELGQAMLKRLGYHVTTRRNSLDALTTFQNQPDSFDLIITDQTMPVMTGVDLARRILQIRPRMPIILCTGYSSQITEDKAKAAGIKGFAFKPLTKKDMGVLIRKVLDGRNP